MPVLLHLLAELPSLRTALVMVQAEVADRLAAPPGSRTYGVPSVKAGFFGTVRRAGSVGRAVFWPVPQVESGLVRIDRYAESPWPIDEATRAQVFAVVDAAFGQRRKTLRAALAGWAGSPAAAQERLRPRGSTRPRVGRRWILRRSCGLLAPDYASEQRAEVRREGLAGCWLAWRTQRPVS